jgi:hypothetical protein
MTEVLVVADAQADVDPRLEQVQALNQRLDDLEEFRLPEVIEHDDGTPLARVRSSVNADPHGGDIRPHPQITLVREGHHHVIDGVMVTVIAVMFVSTLVLMAQALVWLIVS